MDDNHEDEDIDERRNSVTRREAKRLLEQPVVNVHPGTDSSLPMVELNCGDLENESSRVPDKKGNADVSMCLDSGNQNSNRVGDCGRQECDVKDVLLQFRPVDCPAETAICKKGSSNDITDTGMARQSVSAIYKNRQHTDNTNTFIQDYEFGWFDKLVGLASVILFFADIGTDVNLVITYARNDKWFWAIETAVIVTVPSLIVSCLGFHWYVIDYYKDEQKYGRPYTWHWTLRFLFTILQCGPVVRTIEYLYCGVKSRSMDIKPQEQFLYYRRMLCQNVDICLLHLFESFFEAAPQLTIQIYIMIVLKPENDFLHASIIILSLITSWISLAASLTSYNKALRVCDLQKANMSLISVPFYFVWRASEIGGRILCIAMFASVFRYWVLLVLALHWMAVSIWLIEQKTTFYGNRCLERAFNLLCGYVMIFCFLNLREGHTRFRCLLFYSIIYVENFVMLAFWFRFTHDLGAWFHLWGLVAVLLLFLVHMTSQLLYYGVFHPTHSIQVCLPCDRYLVYSSMCTDVSPESGRGSKILYKYNMEEPATEVHEKTANANCV